MTVENAHKAGIEVGICGSLGADPELTKTFVDIGVDELSVVPSAILKLRKNIAELD
jgi:phosphotransferase system enzyme I (PtsI)